MASGTKDPDQGSVVPAVDGTRVRMSVSRRSFLRTGTLSAAAVGVLASAPALPGFLQGLEADAPAAEGAGTDAEAAAADVAGPIFAHVTNASSGELSLYVGERQIAYRDPALVQHLLRAAGR
jgi:hypothetical protein